MYGRNDTFIVRARFSVRDCKRNERGDSNHEIYFEWPKEKAGIYNVCINIDINIEATCKNYWDYEK